jgi:hypothetical protein
LEFTFLSAAFTASSSNHHLDIYIAVNHEQCRWPSCAIIEISENQRELKRAFVEPLEKWVRKSHMNNEPPLAWLTGVTLIQRHRWPIC